MRPLLLHRRTGLTVEEVGERYWIQASPELHYILTTERGWSHELYENWLYDALSVQILPGDKASEKA